MSRRVVAVALTLATIVGAARPAAGAQLILNTQDFAPFSYEVNGAVAGPAADIIRRVCAEAKLECTMRLLPWRRAQQEVEEGKAHGMFVIGWNAARAKWLHFSPPLLGTEYGFFVRTDHPLVFRQNADVKGFTVGVYGPSNTATALEKIKAEIQDLTIDMTPDDEAAFKKLSLGRVDAVYSNRDVGLDLLRRLGITNVRYAGRQQSLKYFIGFSQKSTDRQLVDRFNASFRELHRQGVIQEILGRYRMDAVALE
ncbi:MAG TPA: transporter substrate-binding domain-containing protein [Candidatus Tectomicrobia bacterium]|nr:transporter substrate-binding domain-containing protein [Candidatus Tectomicrobia bacterium]